MDSTLNKLNNIFSLDYINCYNENDEYTVSYLYSNMNKIDKDYVDNERRTYLHLFILNLLSYNDSEIYHKDKQNKENLENKILEIIKYMISKLNMDINQKDIYGNTFIHYLSYSLLKKVHNKIYDYTFSLKPNLDIQNNKGYTPLHFSILSHNYTFSKLLIKKGANQNIKDNNHLTPIFMLISNCDLNVKKFKKLLILFNSFDSKDNLGNTLSHYIFPTGINILIDCLHSLNINFNIKNNNNLTALDLIPLKRMNKNRLILLINYGLDIRNIVYTNIKSDSFYDEKSMLNFINILNEVYEIHQFNTDFLHPKFTDYITENNFYNLQPQAVKDLFLF